MTFKKILIVLLALFFSTSPLLSQSLVDIAKKERERRAKLKGKKGIVVTNADLHKVKKRTTVFAVRPLVSELETEPEIKPAREPSSGKEKSPKSQAEEEKIFKEQKASLEEKWNKAKELVSLYTTKMNGLWQEFYSLDDMTSRDKIQREISETNLKLQKAREDETKAKEELDKFLAQARKKGIPPGWLK